MADQIIPFLALADGKSEVTVEEITDHCLTNIFVLEKILEIKFEVEGEKGKFGKILVNGVGFENKFFES
jgi:RNA 3'-terminal phosphate cyclase